MSTEDAGRKKKDLLLAMSNSSINTGQRDETAGRRTGKQRSLLRPDGREATFKKNYIQDVYICEIYDVYICGR